jgi:hypothetical protein
MSESTAVARPMQHGVAGMTSEATGSVTDLLRIAVERGTPVAELKELVALHDQMSQRQARQEFFAAMAAFQRECPSIKKGSTAKIATRSGSNYEYTFAGLDEIASIVNPILARHSLSYRWDSKVEKDVLTCVCIVMHASGHSETSSFTLPVENASAMSAQQKVGAALTFARRQSLSAALGLTTTDEDPDAGRDDPTPITDDQVTEIVDMMASKKVNAERFLKYMGVADVADIRASDYQKAVTALLQVKAR